MIKKWYQCYVDYVDKWFRNIKERFFKEETEYDKTIKLIENIEPIFFKAFNKQDKAGYSVVSHYENIELLLTKVSLVVKILHEDKIVYSSWDTGSSRDVNATMFFLTNKGNYLDEEIYVRQFKTLAVEYFDLYFKCLDYSNGNKGHNARVLSHFTRSLELTIASFLNLQKSLSRF